MSNFGDLIQEYYVRKFRENFTIRQEKLAKLKTAADAKKYVAEAKKRIAKAYNFPAKACPLNVRITGTQETPQMTVKNILFDSRPNFPVSANLYIPKKLAAKKVPGVLVLAGHAAFEGKACDTYQSVMLSLCLKGCIVLAVDPIGQGERRQYPDVDGLVSCAEHNQFNRRMVMMGDTFGCWRVYDAIRSIDYLLTVPGVDPKRIGVTGNSGGGTLTTLVNGMDDRITAAAPSCYITRWRRNVENELPVDAEQIPPFVAQDGGEMADFLIAQAPRPVMILGQKNDFFDIRGTKDVYEEVKKVYTLLGKPENVGFFAGPTNHGYSIHNREAAYGFFTKTFGLKANAKEPKFEIFSQESLNAAPGGLTINVPGSSTVNDLLFARVRELIAKRKKLSAPQLKTQLKKLFGIGKVEVPYYRQLRGRHSFEGKKGFSRYGIETEPGILCTMFLCDEWASWQHIPESDKAELYVPNTGSCEELITRELPKNRRLFAIDYRGVGESMPNGCDQPAKRSIFDYYTFDYHYDSLALLRGESMVGARVYDVLCAIKLLNAQGVKEITLTASGIGEIIALFAAFLSDVPVKLALKKRVKPYADYALSSESELPQSMVPWNILSLTDLDEIQDFVEARKH